MVYIKDAEKPCVLQFKGKNSDALKFGLGDFTAEEGPAVQSTGLGNGMVVQ